MLFKHNLNEILKDCEKDGYKLRHDVVPPSDFRAVYRQGITPNKEYVILSHSTGVIMSNTQMEKYTNQDIVREARGDVLIAGLGIGMILLEIQDKPEVTSVTVVELSSQIIDMIASQLPLNDKVTIVNEDIFNLLSREEYADRMFDTIYFDIWDYVSDDEREEMEELEDLFRNNFRTGGYMNSWYKEIFDRDLYEYPELWRGFDD